MMFTLRLTRELTEEDIIHVHVRTWMEGHHTFRPVDGLVGWVYVQRPSTGGTYFGEAEIVGTITRDMEKGCPSELTVRRVLRAMRAQHGRTAGTWAVLTNRGKPEKIQPKEEG